MISAIGAVQVHIKSILCDTERSKYLLSPITNFDKHVELLR